MAGHPKCQNNHSELIGCNLVNDEESWAEYYQGYERKTCLTHNLVVCRCGYEIGWQRSQSLSQLCGLTTTITHDAFAIDLLRSNASERKFSGQIQITLDVYYSHRKARERGTQTLFHVCWKLYYPI